MEKFLFIQKWSPPFPMLLPSLPRARQTKYPLDYMLKLADSIERTYTTSLDSIRPAMSADSYNFLLGDIKGLFLQARVAIADAVFNIPTERILESKTDSLAETSRNYLGSFLVFSDNYYRSGQYQNYAVGVLDGVCDRYQSKKRATLAMKYECIAEYLPTKLTPSVMFNVLANDIDRLKDKEELEKIIRRTFARPVDSSDKNYLLHKLEDVYSLKEGARAPDFVVENQNGVKIRLPDFLGKVVYMDFWFNACGPCHALFNNLKPVKEHFKNNNNVVFLNISIDNKHNWLEALQRHDIAGIHVYTEGKEAEHPIIKDYKIYDYPTNRLIGKNGNLFIYAPSTDPAELIRQIDKALNN